MRMPRIVEVILVLALWAEGVAALSLMNMLMHKDVFTDDGVVKGNRSHAPTQMMDNRVAGGWDDPPSMRTRRQVINAFQTLLERVGERENRTTAEPETAWNDMGVDLNQTAGAILSPDFDIGYVNWSLCNASVHNNLAGVGPDFGGEESIRYYNVATAGGGQGVDLVVTANGSYVAKNNDANGLVSGDSCFGVVNLKSHFSGYRETLLLFSFYETGTNTSVALEKFFMSVYDFDTGASAIEHATFFNRVNALYYVPDHEMEISGTLDTVGLTFTSTERGTGADNPKDPANLTAQQKKRAVMVEYSNVTQFRIKFAVSGGKGGGRNFVFASKSNLPLQGSSTTTTATSTVPPKTTLTTTTTEAPPKQNTQTTTTTTKVTHRPDYVDWSLCNVSIHNNLAGVGPTTGEEAIRYFNVVTMDGESVDLVVTADENYAAKNNDANGLVSSGTCFGVVNVKSNASGCRETFLFFNSYLTGTNTSVVMDRFFMTFYDFDSGASATEHATFYDPVHAMYFVQDHEMEITGNLSTVGLTFASTQTGTGADNPKDPSNLTPEQQRRAVMVEYVNVSQFEIKLTTCGGKGGRNFVFAGKSNLPPGVITTTTTTSCDLQSCQVWADPHVSGFDNTDNQGPAYLALLSTRGLGAGSGAARVQTHTFDRRPMDVNAYDLGDFWLVKNEFVYIQARFRLSGEFVPDQAAIGAVAVGGPFIQNCTIVVEPLDGRVTVDGTPLSVGTWSDVSREIYVRLTNDDDVMIELPLRVQLSLKRLPRHVDVAITMPPIPGGMDGECGNYDGIAENDDEDDVRARMGSVQVDDSMLLFATKFDADSEAAVLQRGTDDIPKSASITEEGYRAVAALRDDGAMANFVKKVLASANRFVPPEEEGKLMGFASWFSGTYATRSLRALKQELLNKSWVRDAPALDDFAVDLHALLHTANASDVDVNATDFTAKVSDDFAVDVNAMDHITNAPVGSGFAVNATDHTANSSDGSAVVVNAKDFAAKSSEDSAIDGNATNHAANDWVTNVASMKKASSAARDPSCSECLLWGSSRVLSFSAFRKHAARHPLREEMFRTQDWQTNGKSIAETGTFWLVKSLSLEIQGRFWRSASGVSLGALAVSGSFLGGDRLFIRNGQAMWNDQKILTGFPSNFTNRFVTAKYSPDTEFIAGSNVSKGMQFTFHNGMSLTVHHHHRVLDAKIHMCETHAAGGTILGHCGGLEANRQHNKYAKAARLMATRKLQKADMIFPGATARSFLSSDRAKAHEDGDDFEGDTTQSGSPPL